MKENGGVKGGLEINIFCGRHLFIYERFLTEKNWTFKKVQNLQKFEKKIIFSKNSKIGQKI